MRFILIGFDAFPVETSGDMALLDKKLFALSPVSYRPAHSFPTSLLSGSTLEKQGFRVHAPFAQPELDLNVKRIFHFNRRGRQVAVDSEKLTIPAGF